ncbi:MAG: hypothetical protein HYV29_00910 [Ignavibacteriales bacterium]|nr:hypothetical protein [Ignavibacteriales bacterium]
MNYALTLCMLACSADIAFAQKGKQPDEPYEWVQLSTAAPYSQSYNFQIFSIRDTLWVFHSEGVWFSPDGTSWVRSPLSNILGNNAFLDYVYFNDQVYALGHFEGNIEHFRFTPSVYATVDLKRWTLKAGVSNLPKRFFAHPFVFRDKVWIIGGTDAAHDYGDIWNSSDGVMWTRAANALPFAKRSGEHIILFNGRLLMLADDVWESSDAIHWRQICPKIADEQIYGYSPVVFDGKIWLIGCSRNGKFASEVLVSTDGVTWESKRAPWSPRGGVAACVLNDMIVMTGGKYGGIDPSNPEFVYNNDVWGMRKK